MDEKKYITPEKASQMLKVTPNTLRKWNNTGKIKCVRTKGNHRRFLLSDIISNTPNFKLETPPKRNICYCRVSSHGQKEDLERQVKFFADQYPNHQIIKDIGSGINFKRKGFQTLVDEAIKGNIGEIVVTHKDRLCRFGFELIEGIVQNHSNGKIVVLDQKETSPQEELVNDLLSIITVFSSRLDGLRSHSLKNKIKKSGSATLENSKNENFSNIGGTTPITNNDGSIQVVL